MQDGLCVFGPKRLVPDELQSKHACYRSGAVQVILGSTPVELQGRW